MRFTRTELLVVLLLIACILFVPRLFFKSRQTSIAESHQSLAQAICNYRAQHGLLPLELKDLVPDYLPQTPAGFSYFNGSLSIPAGLPHTYVCYSFADEKQGWSSSGDFGVGPLAVPRVAPTVPVLEGEERIRATLAEYDRRIGSCENDCRHRTQKIAYLFLLKKMDDAYAECVKAAEAHPDWWRARMGIAMFAPDDKKEDAESNLRAWVEKYPGFLHSWYLAHYYRTHGLIDDALEALGQGVKYPLEHIDSDATWVPHAFAFDAAAFACKEKRPDLTLAITEMWASPRGVYNYESPDMPAFRAAALLALGRFAEAKGYMAKVLRTKAERAIWAGNLEQLHSAIQREDRSFVYDPGSPYEGFGEWQMFPTPDP